MEDRINAEVAARPGLEHVLLQCSAVNDIDASALESLEAITSRLKDSGIALHFSEIKGPVMDKLNTTHFLQHLQSFSVMGRAMMFCLAVLFLGSDPEANEPIKMSRCFLASPRLMSG